MTLSLPLFDCRLDADDQRAAAAVLGSGALAAGPFVGALETALDARFPGRNSVALSDMTQAIGLALRLAGVGPGDDVLTLALNCMSSNSAIVLAGARPIWVDVDPATMTIDLQDCARALTPRTRALVVYHVAGYPADLSAIEAFCRANGLIFIEDANNALGARTAGRAVGTGGDFSVLSFYANRQVNAIEGAALLCADPMDGERARRLRRFGVDAARFRDADGEIAATANVAEIGIPASLSNVNACLAYRQLDRVDQRVAKNRAHAAFLREHMAGSNILPVQWRAEDAPAFWTFLVRSPDRDGLMRILKRNGVHCSKLHQRNDRYSGFASMARDLPGTTIFENEALALPVGWWLDQTQLTFMTSVLRDASGTYQ